MYRTIPVTYFTFIFVASSELPVMACEFGLRINVTVKEHKCKAVGEPQICWNKGRCVTSYDQVQCTRCTHYVTNTSKLALMIVSSPVM